jgi:uncharacterized membrane protein
MIDHQILGIHHVHPGAGQLAWDLGFLAFGLTEVAGGWWAIRSDRAQVRAYFVVAHLHYVLIGGALS